jgi:3-hydroxyacyl-CoA dehydrogenase
MKDIVRIERVGDVAIIVVDNPPVNALSQPVRAGLLAAMELLDVDPAVRAIVLAGAGRAFMAGADVRELEAPPEAPLLKDVLMRLESCRKPVIAALHGMVLGGGAEAALASHYRYATSDLQLGFPEVKLGLLPGAGGTVRLPRLLGVKTALDLMTSGEPIGLGRAHSLGLIDRSGSEDARTGAMRFAQELLAGGAGARRARDRAIPDAHLATTTFFREYRAALSRAARRSAAVERIVQSVEAAVQQGFEPALDLAQALFQQCRTSIESRAQRHLFWAERSSKATREGGRPIATVGVIGGGTMGSGIAASCLRAGFAVTLVESSSEALKSALARTSAIFDGAVRKGRMQPDERDAIQRRLRTASELPALADVDLVIEAVFEDLAIKQKVFGELGRVAKPGAVLASNTSTLDVRALARASGRPRDVVGMHFFSPAYVMRLIEVVRTEECSPEAIAAALGVARRLDKIGVVVGNAFGFVGNRMLYAYGREKELTMLEGATPAQVDRALEDFGMAMGPNAVGDLAGLDVGAAARRQWKDRPDDPRFYRVSDMLVERGRLGQKSGRGFYRYVGPEKHRESDPEVIEMIRAEAARLRIPQRQVASDEIVERCILSLIHEGARILEEGIAQAAADIDVIWCNGYGFPRARGGPMFHADALGLPAVLQAIDRYRGQLGERYWGPAALLERLAKEQRRLSEMAHSRKL